jgi:RNA polymerase sigma-70 factor (ECF subfamily)
MDAITTSDTELSLAAREGDAQALAALLERHRPGLYAAALALLGNREDAADAVQDTCVVALLRLAELREVAAARAWLHAVLRNVCLMRLRRRREVPVGDVELPGTVPGPEAALEQHVMGEWLWQALEALSPDERATLLLRHFTRCTGYQEIARLTAVPVGTVRSRLNRARARLADALTASVTGTAMSHAELVDTRSRTWQEFYRTVHDRPEPRTYRELFAPEVEVGDSAGQWHGIGEWSAEERAAISLGVRATVVNVLAGTDITVVEIDFANPAEWPDHCPPQATFVHRLSGERSQQVRIHYPVTQVTSHAPER